jgi:cell division cycle 14
MNHQWFDPLNFNVGQYDDMSSYTYGDVNWVVPGEVLAMAGPKDEQQGGQLSVNSSSKIAGVLKSLQIKSMFRLNESDYDRNNIIKAGIEHFDHPYPDGTVPEEVISNFQITILRLFLTLLECIYGDYWKYEVM